MKKRSTARCGGPPALSQVRSATRAPPCRRLMKESARVFKGNVRSDDWTRVVRPVAASGRALEEISAAAAPGLRRRRSAPNVIHGSGGSCGTPRGQIGCVLSAKAQGEEGGKRVCGATGRVRGARPRGHTCPLGRWWGCSPE